MTLSQARLDEYMRALQRDWSAWRGDVSNRATPTNSELDRSIGAVINAYNRLQNDALVDEIGDLLAARAQREQAAYLRRLRFITAEADQWRDRNNAD